MISSHANVGQPTVALDTDFREIFERSPSALGLVDVSGPDVILKACNAQLRTILGHGATAVVGRPLQALFLTETALTLEGAIQRVAAMGQPVRLSLHALRSIYAGRFDVTLTAGDGGRPSGQVLMTLEPRTVRAGLTTFDQLEALGEGMIIVFDMVRLRARYMASELARSLDHAMDGPFELETMREVVHPDDFQDLASYATELGMLGHPERASVTVRIRKAEGGWRWLEFRGRALALDHAGKARTILGVATDITERRAMARALDRATQTALAAGEQERRRVARNLHDSTAQHLVAIDLGLSNLERRLPPGPETTAGLQDIRESLAAAHREIRTYSYLLHPPELHRLGLEATLKRFAEGFGRRSSLAVGIEVRGAPYAIPSETELTLFRVAQEAMMNVHRHAHATAVTVRLTRASRSIVLEVDDNGVGFAATSPDDPRDDEGVGLPGMRARMAHLGGLLELIPLKKGVRVRAEAPI